MKLRRQWLLPVFICAIIFSSAFDIGSARADDRAVYEACLAEVQKDPKKGHARALRWRREGGGAAATHCAALALFALNRFAEAAKTLEHLAQQLPEKGKVERADVWAQAANAWLIAGEAQKAEAAIEKAIKRFPGDPDMLIDRARIRAEMKNYRGALADLDKVILVGSDGALVQAFRAAALRQLGRLEDAAKAAEKALALDANNLEARLERGLVRLAEGDRKAARQDLEFLAKRKTDSPAGKSAALHLARLMAEPSNEKSKKSPAK